MNIGFHGNQIGDIVAIELLKSFFDIPNRNKWNVSGEF